jgi:hypothetical protein
MQAVDVDDGYLVFVPSDRLATRRWDAAYEVPHMRCGSMKPAPERIYSDFSTKSLSAPDSAPQISPLRPASCRTLA